MKRKILSLLLSLTMVITMIPAMSVSTMAKDASTNSAEIEGLPMVLATAKPSGASAIKLEWLETKGATKYVVSGNLYGKKYKKLKTLDETKTSFKVKKIAGKALKKGKPYKFKVTAYGEASGEAIGQEAKLSTSKDCIAISGKTMTENNKTYSDATEIKIKVKTVKLVPGDTAKAKNIAGISSIMYRNKKHLSSEFGKKYSYIVLNKDNKVDNTTVEIDEAGKIIVNKKAKAGTNVSVYVQELNGSYNKFKIKVTTEKESEGGASQTDIDTAYEEGQSDAQKEAFKKTQEKAISKTSAIVTRMNSVIAGLSENAKTEVESVIESITLSLKSSVANAKTQEEIDVALDEATDKLNAIEELVKAAGDNPSKEIQECLIANINNVSNASNIVELNNITDIIKGFIEEKKNSETEEKTEKEQMEAAKEKVRKRIESINSRIENNKDTLGLTKSEKTEKTYLDKIMVDAIKDIESTSDASARDDIVNNALAKVNAIEKVIDELEITPKSPLAKGEIITLKEVDVDEDGEQDSFRVIKNNGKQAELLAMNGNKVAFENSMIIYYDEDRQIQSTNTYQSYRGSNLENYLIGYYVNLPEDIRNSIVYKEITQPVYEYRQDYTNDCTYEFDYNFGEDYYYAAQTDKETAKFGANVYALDISDIYDYIGGTCIDSSELNKMFFDEQGSIDSGRNCWLRSGLLCDDDSCWSIDAEFGTLCSVSRNSEQEAHPAFTIYLNNANIICGSDLNMEESATDAIEKIYSECTSEAQINNEITKFKLELNKQVEDKEFQAAIDVAKYKIASKIAEIKESEAYKEKLSGNLEKSANALMEKINNTANSEFIELSNSDSDNKDTKMITDVEEKYLNKLKQTEDVIEEISNTSKKLIINGDSVTLKSVKGDNEEPIWFKVLRNNGEEIELMSLSGIKSSFKEYKEESELSNELIKFNGEGKHMASYSMSDVSNCLTCYVDKYIPVEIQKKAIVEQKKYQYAYNIVDNESEVKGTRYWNFMDQYYIQYDNTAKTEFNDKVYLLDIKDIAEYTEGFKYNLLQQMFSIDISSNMDTQLLPEGFIWLRSGIIGDITKASAFKIRNDTSMSAEALNNENLVYPVFTIKASEADDVIDNITLRDKCVNELFKNIDIGIDISKNSIIKNYADSAKQEMNSTKIKDSIKIDETKAYNKLGEIALSNDAMQIISSSIESIVTLANKAVNETQNTVLLNEIRNLSKLKLQAIRELMVIAGDISENDEQFNDEQFELVKAIVNISKSDNEDEIDEIKTEGYKEVQEAGETPIVEKGKLIELSGAGIPDVANDVFRVIKVRGNKAELMAMESDICTAYYNNGLSEDNYEKIKFGHGEINKVIKYAGSDIDELLNGNSSEDSYYHYLPDEIKNAIIPQDIEQLVGLGYAPKFPPQIYENLYPSVYKGEWYPAKNVFANSTEYNVLTYKDAKLNVGERKVYLLDINDVAEYILGMGMFSSDKKMHYADMLEMFFNEEPEEYTIQHSMTLQPPYYLDDCWLRTTDEHGFLKVEPKSGAIDSCECDGDYNLTVRPSFTIDLSKVEWQESEPGK